MDKKRVFLDKLDLFIIKEIYEREITGTRILAVDYFFKDVKKEDLGRIYKQVDAKNVLINSRLKNLGKNGLVIVEKKQKSNGTERNEYSLNLKNIKIKTYKFRDEYLKAILLKVNNKWQIFEL